AGRAADSKSAGRGFESPRPCRSRARRRDEVSTLIMMTDQNVDEKATEQEPEAAEAEMRAEDDLALDERAEAMEPAVPTQLGATRHVLAGFFAAGIAVAFIVS